MFNNELVTLIIIIIISFQNYFIDFLVKTKNTHKSKKTTYYSINNYLRGKAKKVQKNGLET